MQVERTAIASNIEISMRALKRGVAYIDNQELSTWQDHSLKYTSQLVKSIAKAMMNQNSDLSMTM